MICETDSRGQPQEDRGGRAYRKLWNPNVPIGIPKGCARKKKERPGFIPWLFSSRISLPSAYWRVDRLDHKHMDSSLRSRKRETRENALAARAGHAKYPSLNHRAHNRGTYRRKGETLRRERKYKKISFPGNVNHGGRGRTNKWRAASI